MQLLNKCKEINLEMYQMPCKLINQIVQILKFGTINYKQCLQVSILIWNSFYIIGIFLTLSCTGAPGGKVLTLAGSNLCGFL